MTRAASSLNMTGPVAMRALAQAFASFGEFNNFVKGLQAALDQVPHFERLSISVPAALMQGSPDFSSGALTLPLTGGSGSIGTLEVSPPAQHRQFGPEDLHLMGGLAEFLSAALFQAGNFRELNQRSELLRFLLNQAPIGVAAYDENGRLIVANELAQRWLGDAGSALQNFLKTPGGFHLRANGKLIYGEARRATGLTSEAGAWIVVLQDLTPEQARLLELVKRETYRSLVENERLGVAFIESAPSGDGILRQLPELRAALLPGETAGPYDARRIGLVFPETNGISLRARLRKLRDVFVGREGLRLGYAELGRDGRTPELLLEKALQRVGAYDEMLRPVLLVHDDSAAVADTFAMVLGREFQVVKSTSPERTRELLATEAFEGFVTEMELRNGVSGMELVRYAREKQPGIKPFFTTVQRAPYGLPAGATEEDALVLEKPFDIDLLTQIVRTNLLN